MLRSSRCMPKNRIHLLSRLSRTTLRSKMVEKWAFSGFWKVIVAWTSTLLKRASLALLSVRLLTQVVLIALKEDRKKFEVICRLLARTQTPPRGEDNKKSKRQAQVSTNATWLIKLNSTGRVLMNSERWLTLLFLLGRTRAFQTRQ